MRSFFGILLAASLLMLSTILPAQTPDGKPDIQRVEPAFWFTGMKHAPLQILFYGKGIGNASVTCTYAGVDFQGVVKTENPNYLFVNLHITPEAKPGTMNLVFTQGGKEKGGKEQGGKEKERTYAYELRTKSTDKRRIQGITGADVVYMLMPDRFANGDPNNDVVPGMLDYMNRDSMNARHGGDIQGIMEHLEYIKDLGCTAVWSTPLLENNVEYATYHGYAITDFYAIDARFGTNDLYKRYVEKAHGLGLKIIKDMVLNHCGRTHWFINDPPTADWAHYLGDFKTSKTWKQDFPRGNYNSITQSDPYASIADKREMTDPWFDWMMPDMNQQSPLLATYLIQNALWWIEYAGIDGMRVDTYTYPDKDFTARWSKAIMTEYPQFYIVGEILVNDAGVSAYWQSNTRNKDGYVSNLPAITDFPWYKAVNAMFNEADAWETGLIRMYNVLADDFQYTDASRNLIFLDNHDMNRFFSMVGEDIRKLKLGMTLLLTTRGIPQLYYETELAMPGMRPDPLVRKDFPGGWKTDAANAFTSKGRTTTQNEAFTYFKSLAEWRKTSSAIHNGKLTHFLPQNEMYVYFRHNAEQTVMVVLNKSDKEAKSLKTARFSECMRGYTKAKNVLTGEIVADIAALPVAAKSALVLELLR
jgi:neopullulanase